jgi:hypothetical protein
MDFAYSNPGRKQAFPLFCLQNPLAVTVQWTINAWGLHLLEEGITVRFTPTFGFSGLARFDFAVDDGCTATDAVSVLVHTPAGTGTERRQCIRPMAGATIWVWSCRVSRLKRMPQTDTPLALQG